MKSEQINNTDGVFRNIISGDRPLTLIFLFAVTEVSKAPPAQVVEYSPVLLMPLLVIATFILTRQLTSNDSVAILQLFLSTISFQTLIGIYFGYYANWLLVAPGIFGVCFNCKVLKKPSKFILASSALVIIGCTAGSRLHMECCNICCVCFLIHIARAALLSQETFSYIILILSTSIVVDIGNPY